MKNQPFYPPVGSRAGATARHHSNEWWNAILRERDMKKSGKNLTISDRRENGSFLDRWVAIEIANKPTNDNS
jgi:hypothetical protein